MVARRSPWRRRAAGDRAVGRGKCLARPTSRRIRSGRSWPNPVIVIQSNTDGIAARATRALDDAGLSTVGRLLAALGDVRALSLSETAVASLAPLAGLNALQSLDLSGTQVVDLKPLAGLAALQSLDVSGTDVASLEPLARLTMLQSLDLSGTNVADVGPLKRSLLCRR